MDQEPNQISSNTIEADIQKGLRDIRELGVQKPLGYLPIDSLRTYFRSSVEAELERAKGRGYGTIVLGPKEADIGFKGALYVYDKQALSALLAESAPVLQQFGWPTNVEGFIRRIANEHVKGGKIRKIIDRAFGQKEK